MAPAPPLAVLRPASARRTTLFAVMAADVIMLNLWAHDVGRADGQAYSVLRSVFEEAVRLYQGKDDGGDTTGEAGVLQEGDAPAGEAGRFPKARFWETGVPRSHAPAFCCV